MGRRATPPRPRETRPPGVHRSEVVAEARTERGWEPCPPRRQNLSDPPNSFHSMSITPAQLAEWRRIIREEGALHSALAQRIAPMLMDEIERAWAQLERTRREEGAREAAALRKRLAAHRADPSLEPVPAR